MKKIESALIWESYLTANEQLGSNPREVDADDEAAGLDAEDLGAAADQRDSEGYVQFLKSLADQGPGMENVLSHPFEETYGEYLRQKEAVTPYKAAVAHKALAEKMGVYHEVNLDALENWKYS